MRRYLSATSVQVIIPVKAMTAILTGVEDDQPPVVVEDDPDPVISKSWYVKLWEWLCALFIVLVICTSSMAQSGTTGAMHIPQMYESSTSIDTISTRWIGDAIELANKLISQPDAQDPVRIQKAICIKIKNVGRKTKMISQLNKKLAKKELQSYQYDVLMADVLGIQINEVKQLRALSE